MTVSAIAWGEFEGRPVQLYTLANLNGVVARITNYGAAIVELHVPDRHGVLDDIALGFDTLADYISAPYFFGATVGRVGNRIANARFELEGQVHELAANDGAHHLHGGRKGWDKVVWTAIPVETPSGPSLRLAYRSPDGEEGYPGAVDVTTQYTLTNDDELAIEMTATTDRTTILNMVHHTYFNLNAPGDGDVRDHVLQLFADAYTPGMPPDGSVLPVVGTPFDFTSPKPIGRDLKVAGSPEAAGLDGYDSNWVVNGESGTTRPVARLEDPVSGRVMTLRANQPGVQFYSGVFLDGSTSGKGRRHVPGGGLCLETQAFPDAINVPAWRDQVVLEPGQTYRHEMIFAFSAR